MAEDIFSKNITLENERVLLRPLVESDYEHLVSFAVNEPDLWQFSMQHIGSPEGMKAYIDAAIKQRHDQKEYPFIVFDKKVNAYAGSTRFYDIQQNNLTTQLGYTWYGKAFHRTGLNRHCKFLLLQFAFESWELERVEFRADANNNRSIEAMKGIGCTVEGILRNHMPTYTGKRRSSIVLSILRNEWQESVKENLLTKIH